MELYKYKIDSGKILCEIIKSAFFSDKKGDIAYMEYTKDDGGIGVRQIYGINSDRLVDDYYSYEGECLYYTTRQDLDSLKEVFDKGLKNKMQSIKGRYSYKSELVEEQQEMLNSASTICLKEFDWE